jgi:hypothetical protein
MRSAYILVESPERRDHSEDLIADGRIIFKRMSGILGLRKWIGYMM